MKGFLKKLLPWIGAAATGNIPGLIGTAAQQIGGILGTKVEGSLDAIAQAVSGATPEQILKLRELDQQFEIRMRELGFKDTQELETIAQRDRESARARETAVRDKIPALLSILITAGFFGVLSFMLFRAIPEQGHDALLIMLGALGSAWMAVVTYYFGSSLGSARKDERWSAEVLNGKAK